MFARFLVADPPWEFGDRLPGGGRGAEKHYTCMSLSDILRMPLPPIHQDAVLFLWRVSSMVEEAYQVAHVWGFKPKSEIVWNKTDATGEKDALGMGHIVRGSHETCIVATRGRIIKPQSRSERTSFRAPRAKHSEKPEEFYRIVERLYPLELWPESHVELFARRRRKGWIQFGDELTAEPTEHTEPALDPPRQSWRGASRMVARDEDEWASESLRSWQHEIIGTAREMLEEPEKLIATVDALAARSFDVPIAKLAAMSVLQRSVLGAYLEQGGDPPEFLTPFVRGGAPAP
jgi:N6-adenosine-specific RNA methylase IME4